MIIEKVKQNHTTRVESRYTLFCSGTFLLSSICVAPRGLKKVSFQRGFARYLEYLRSLWIHRWFTTSKSTCAGSQHIDGFRGDSNRHQK